MKPGSGELTYFDGSHLVRCLVFGDDYKSWLPESDGRDDHDRFMTELVERCKAAGLPRAVPRYFDQFPAHAVRRPYGPGHYASVHYEPESEP